MKNLLNKISVILSMLVMLVIYSPAYAGNIINISTRANVGGGQNDVFAGFVVEGTVSKRVIIRGISVDEGVDPAILVLDHFSKAEIGQNNDWQDNANAHEIEALASNLQLPGTKDAGLLLNLNPGVYDVVLSSSGSAGLALVSVDDVQSDSEAKIINISTRANVSGGSHDVFAGFVIDGATQKRVIIRGIGVADGVDPDILVLNHFNKAEIGQNNNWQDNINAHEIESLASNLQLPQSTDAGLLLDLDPGVYDVVLSSQGASGLALVSVDEVAVPLGNTFILGIVTDITAETRIGGVLAPNIIATINTTRLSDAPVKIMVETESGEKAVTPISISEDRQSVSFEVPADIVDGKLTLQGQGYLATSPYTAFYASSPYIATMSPETSRAGDKVEITGVNLPSTPIKLVFTGMNPVFTQTVTPAAGKVSFTVPENAVSGEVYLTVAQLETNRLDLSVKKTINVQVRQGAEVNFNAADISFILGLKEHRLNISYTAELAVENNDLQYIHAMVDLPNDEFSLLYNAVVLPDTSETITVDAKSTAVAWVFMGMGTSVSAEKSQWRPIYNFVAANEKVQVFADYIDVLQKNDFTAWSNRSDSQLKTKFQDALRDVILSSPGVKNARIATQFESDTGVIIKQDPANDNIYIDLQQLDGGGSVTLINDTKLYLSAEVKSNEEGNKGQIVEGYKHVENAVITNEGTLIAPKGWGLLGISSAQTLQLRGEDSHIQIITAAWDGEPKESALADSLRARVFIEGVALPTLNMLLTTIMDKRVANGYKPGNFVDAMQTVYGGADFLKQLTTQVSSKSTGFGAMLDTLIIIPVKNGFNSCFQVPEGAACGKTMLGVAKLLGISSAENIQKKIMLMIARSIEKRILKKSVALIPFAGWVAEAAFIVHDNIGYISDSATIAESLYDMNVNPKQIQFDVEFPLQISSVLPLCVTYQPGDTTQTFLIQGDGFEPLDDIEPIVTVGVGSDKTEAQSLSISSTGTDMSAHFDFAELMNEGSWTDVLQVKNYGYWVTFPEDIRMVASTDATLYFDSISPLRAMTGGTITLNGCGWTPVEEIEVTFAGKEGLITAEILDKDAEQITVKIPDEAIPGYVTVTTANKKAQRFFHIKPFALNKATVEELADKLDFELQGYGLGELAHIYFIDHKQNRIEGIASKISDTGLSTGVPGGLAAGLVRIVVELKDGRVSNEFIIPKVPNKPVASPESGTFEFSVTVTLSVEGEGDLYYRLDRFTSSPEFRYTGPKTLKIEDSEYENIYLYAFARVAVDGVNYDSEIAEYVYTPSDITPVPLPTTKCPVTYDPELDDDSSTGSIRLDLRDKDGDDLYEDYLYCGYDGSGHLLLEASYVDNRVNGIVKKFYDSGQLKEETPYVSGNRQGLSIEYYPSGKLEMETPFVNGNEHGIAKEYYESGQLKLQKPFVDGNVHGLVTGYYESGKLGMETPYVNGEKHGIAKEYYESGQLKLQTPFVDGNVHGLVTGYYESGQPALELPFIDDKEHGIGREYYESGSLMQEIPYVNGDQVGAILGYYETGELQYEITEEGEVLTMKVYATDGALIGCTLTNLDNGEEIGSCMP